MPEKFFLISQVFHPDQVSTGNLFTDLCSELAAKGTDVEVWAAQPSYHVTERQPETREYNGFRIRYLFSTNFRKTNLFGRVLNTLTFSLSSSLKLLFSKDKTPVWTHTTPPFLGILLSLVCALKKRKFIYILLDIFPEGLIRLGKISSGNPFAKIWHWFFVISLKKCCKIIVIGRDMQRLISSFCPECTGSLEYIPLWQSDRLIRPVPVNESRFVIANSLEGKYLIQYSGNMGLWNEMTTIGKAASGSFENIAFVFVGNGRRKKELLDELPHEGNGNIWLLPFQSNERFNDVLAASHVQLVSLKKDLEGIAVPSKIYGILAAERPVIAIVPEDSEIAMIVKEENCGIIVSPEDPAGIVNAIRMLQSDKALSEQMALNGRRAFEKKYTTKIVSERYKALLCGLR